jgi:putative DNA primase/helicase
MTTGRYVQASVNAGAHSSAYDRLVAALETHDSTVRANGTRAMAQCPGHDDHNPSLSLRRTEGRVLIRCFAGCQTVDVLAALNMTLRDLYDEPKGSRLATYTYGDGRLVHRLQPGPDGKKRFSQSGKTKGTRQLFHREAVEKAVADDVTIYITEGEEDVFAVESLGAVATTCPEGAGTWSNVDSTPLRGGKIVVIADRDEPGIRHARDVVASLDGKVASLRVVHAKVGKDVSDHIAAGHDLDELLEVSAVELLEVSTATVVTLADVEPERVTWLWDGHLPAGKLVMLDGDPSVGKSTLAIDWAARLSTGAPWPDGTGCPLGDVLVLSAEDGLADTIRPRLDAAGGDPARVHALTDVTFRDDEGNLRQRSVTLADVEQINFAIAKFGARLVIIDVLMAYLPAKVDSHKDQDIRSVLARLADLGEKTGCCILLLRHMNKSSGVNPLYRGGGSIGIVGAARAGFVAATDPDDETRRVLASTKQNLAPEPESMAYRLVGADNGAAKVEWLGSSTATASTLLAAHERDDERSERDEAVEWLIDYLSANGGQADRKDLLKLARADGISESTLKRARTRAGIEVTRQGFGGGSVWSLPHSVHHSVRSDQLSEGGLNGLNGDPNGESGPRRTHEEPEEPASQDVRPSGSSVSSSGHRTALADIGPPDALFDVTGESAHSDDGEFDRALRLVTEQLDAAPIKEEPA